MLDLNEALEKLAALDARKARVVELQIRRLQAGRDCRGDEGSVVTVRRDWTSPEAWLYAELRKAG